jgi:hypothetical protein
MESEFNGHLGICFKTIKAQSDFDTKDKRQIISDKRIGFLFGKLCIT